MASVINNAFYDELGDRWYEDDTHAIAILRAESRLKLDYVRGVLAAHGVAPPARVLDVACGAGFLSVPLARDGFRVKGVDLSAGSLAAAEKRGRGLADLVFCREDALKLAAQDA